MEKLLFTSESVTEGHPDKMCDAISDAILDACMEQDPMSRVACETASCTGFVLVTGEITTKAQLDIPAIVRKTVNEIGYNDAKTGFARIPSAIAVSVPELPNDSTIVRAVFIHSESKSSPSKDNFPPYKRFTTSFHTVSEAFLVLLPYCPSKVKMLPQCFFNSVPYQ